MIETKRRTNVLLAAVILAAGAFLLPPPPPAPAARRLHGCLVVCSEAGITSSSCQTPTPGPFPLARTVNGQTLQSAKAIESAARSGLVTLFDTGATFAANVTGN